MKISKLLILLPAVVIVSGCSLTSGGNDGGVFRSDDGGKTFSAKAKANDNKNISQVDVLSLAANPKNGNEIYLGSKLSGIFKTEDAGESWKQLNASLLTPTKVYSLAVDPADPKNVFAAAVVGKRGKILKSQDGGQNWREIYSEPSDGNLVLAVAIDRQAPDNIFAGTDKGQIILSEDAGETWRNLFWTEKKSAVYKIEIDNFDSSLIYFALFEDGVLRTTDHGKTFEQLQKEKTNELFSIGSGLKGVVSMTADPNREGWIYLGTEEGLLRSRDRGDRWEVLKTLSKPNELNIRSIAINPQNSDEISCSVAQIFYKSVDGGVNWLPVQFNMARTLEVVAYNSQNPAQIFVGMNKR